MQIKYDYALVGASRGYNIRCHVKERILLDMNATNTCDLVKKSQAQPTWETCMNGIELMNSIGSNEQVVAT